jgi:hypothetical protein
MDTWVEIWIGVLLQLLVVKYDCTTCLLPGLLAANGSWVLVGPLRV